MRGGLEAAGEADGGDAHRRLAQELAGMHEPARQCELRRRGGEMALEQPLELSRRDADGGGDVGHVHRPLDRRIHQPGGAGERRVLLLDAGGQRQRLAVAAGARPLHHELVRHLGGDALAVARLDQRQHQVERRDAAGAGEPVAVDDEQVLGERNLGELLADRREVLPVDGGAVAVEEARFGEREGAGTEAAERDAAAGEAAQRVRQPPVDGVADGDAAADEQHVERSGLGELHGGGERQPVAGDRGGTVERRDVPVVVLARRHVVRHPAGFERIDEGDRRVVRQRQEADTRQPRQRRRRRRDRHGRCAQRSTTRSVSGFEQHSSTSPLSISRWRMPPACFMSTLPEISVDLQVPQRPLVHEDGSRMPARRAACSTKPSAGQSIAVFDFAKVTRKVATPLSVESFASAAATASCSGAVNSSKLKLSS
eukprot:Opistho-1_new@39680